MKVRLVAVAAGVVALVVVNAPQAMAAVIHHWTWTG